MTARSEITGLLAAILLLCMNPAWGGGFNQFLQNTLGIGQPSKVIVVLLDTSGSITADDQNLYQRSYDNLLDGLQAGDRLVLAAIGDKPLNRFSAHTDLTSPLTNVQFNDADALKKTKNTLGANYKRLIDSANPSKLTYLLDTIAATAEIFEHTPDSRRILVIMSDMVEESTMVNFNKAPRNNAQDKALITRINHAGLLPQLEGVQVFVAGASGANGEHMMQLKSFWSTYFQSTGATLIQYGRSLVNKEQLAGG